MGTLQFSNDCLFPWTEGEGGTIAVPYSEWNHEEILQAHKKWFSCPRFLMRLIHGCLVSLQLDVCIIFPVKQIFHYAAHSAQFALQYVNVWPE